MKNHFPVMASLPDRQGVAKHADMCFSNRRSHLLHLQVVRGDGFSETLLFKSAFHAALRHDGTGTGFRLQGPPPICLMIESYLLKKCYITGSVVI
jgi:hypothetical protein